VVKAKFDFVAISHRSFWSLWSPVAPDRTRKNDALKRSERDNQPAREGRGLYPKTESKLGSWKNRVEISFSTRFDKYKSTIVKISKYYPYQK
jgi:hypothetical protein